MAEKKPTRARTRTKAVEVPGSAEVGAAPVTHKEIAGKLEEQHLEGKLREQEKPVVDFVQEIEASGAHRHAGYKPQLGEIAGGKVLTIHGWLDVDHPRAGDITLDSEDEPEADETEE